MNRAYLCNARKTMRRHGVFVQGVLADSPLDPPYVYSTGFQLLDPPRPEVIVFGVPVHGASAVVNQVYRRVRDGTATDAFLDQAQGSHVVALPVYRYTQSEGRYELLAATPLDRDRARIGHVPWLADYAAYGDVVAVRPDRDAETGAPVFGDAYAGVLLGGSVVESGGYRTLAFDVVPRSAPAVDRFLDIVLDLTADPAVARASTSIGRLHLNTRLPDEARTALRGLVRDGHLVEVGPRSGPAELPDHPLGACEARHGR